MSDQKPGGMRGWSRSAIVTVAIVAALGAAAIAALLVNITERKGEAQNTFFRVVELTDATEDPAIWGKNFPLQYDGYLQTVDQQRTRTAAARRCRARDGADARSIVRNKRLDEDRAEADGPATRRHRFRRSAVTLCSRTELTEPCSTPAARNLHTL